MDKKFIAYIYDRDTLVYKEVFSGSVTLIDLYEYANVGLEVDKEYLKILVIEEGSNVEIE